MRKSLPQLFFWIPGLAILIMLSGQSDKKGTIVPQQLPDELSGRLDSLRQKDDLTGWLYAYREYVYEEPAKRINILSNVRSQAWRQCKTDAERLEWFNCLIAQGYYLLYNGNILRSIDAYEEGYRFYFDHPFPGTDVLEYVLKPLGNNYTRLGDYDRAFYIQEKALKLAEEKDSSQIASICHNLATTAIWKEDLPLAQQYCERGLQQVVKNSPLHGLLLSTLSEVQLKSGNIALATENSNAAVSILSSQLSDAKETRVAYWLRGAYQGLGDIEKENHHPAIALGYYNKAIALIDQYYKGQRKREKAQLSVLSGHVLLQLNQPQKAMEQYNAALSLMMPSFQPTTIYDLPQASDLYGESSLLDALHGKAESLDALDKKEEALNAYLLLYTVERKLRQEFYSTDAKKQQQKENRRWAESAIATAYDLWKNTSKKEYADKVLLIAEMSKAQLLLDEMIRNLRFNRMKNKDSLLIKQEQMMQAIAYYEKEGALNWANTAADSNAMTTKKELQYELSLIEKQVKEKYPVTETYRAADQLPSADSLLQNIPSATTAIEFFTGEKNIYIIEAVKGNVKQIKKLDSAELVLNAVNNFVDSFFQHGPANMTNSPQQYYTAAHQIYQWLWPEGKKEDHCIIIPDGILGYLPFDALVTDPVYHAGISEWPFLLKKTNLYLGYSLQTAWQQKKIEHPFSSFAGFFVSFDSSQSSIPAVKKEYDAIHAAVSGNFYKDKDASLATFNKQLSEVNLLHISTHSFLQGKENMPVLQLADDKFFLFELYGKTFRPQLVVLSACRTGHGMLAKGEGIISLARGFTATGAAGIIAGLWDMNDETTATLMGMFYTKLGTKHRAADALYDAKIDLLREKNGQAFQKLPYYWAGMVYSGDNEPIETEQKKTSSKWWWWMAAILGGAILILFVVKKFIVGSS